MNETENLKPTEEDTTIGSIKIDRRLSLKNLTSKQKDVCIRSAIEKTANKLNIESTIGNQEGFCVSILFNENPENVLTELNKFIIPTINSYIETELNEKASRYNRSMILFESEIQKDRLFIRWAN